MLSLLLAATVLATVTRTPTPVPSPVAFSYQTPGPQPTPIGSLVLSTAVLTHGQPIKFTELEVGAEVDVNGDFVGYTNAAGSFTIIFPTAGAYTINVGDYPQQKITVN